MTTDTNSIDPNPKETQQSESALHTKNVKLSPNVILPEQLSSVHVDKAMVAIDHSTQTATITLLSSHPIPKISEGWGLDNVIWEVVGEIKMAVPALNALAIYHLMTISGGVDVGRLITEAIQKQQRKVPNDGFSYGPFDIKQTPAKNEQQ